MKIEIGERISAFRKSKCLTQEQLGELVGVSGQAVSKWENGGVPDTYLLPAISTALGVSIDALFGTEKKISEISESEMLDQLFRFSRYNGYYNRAKFKLLGFLFEAIWSIQCAYFGNETRPDLHEVIEDNAGNPEITSQIIDDQGTTYLSLVKGFPFFCAVRDDPEISRKILAEEDFCELFSLFADPDSLNAIIFTQTSTKTDQYTAKGMAEHMGLSLEKFNEIAPMLAKYGLINEDTLTFDDKVVPIYHKKNNPEIRPILMMAYQFIHARQCYYNFMSNRTKPYF